MKLGQEGSDERRNGERGNHVTPHCHTAEARPASFRPGPAEMDPY
jgi:hypothetical protein